MSRAKRHVSIALLCALTLTGCAQKTQELTRELYPTLPRTDCADEPAPPPSFASDQEMIAHQEAVRLAGAECRTRLHAVDDARKSWPNNKPQQPATPSPWW